MALADYTSFHEVRAALGVSDEELSDATLSLPMYEVSLLAEMREISATFRSQYATAHLKVPADRSEEETWFIQTARLFSTYSVARHLLSTLPLFSPKEISDGKAHQTRYSTDPYKATISAVKEQYERYRTVALAAFSSLQQVSNPARVAPVFLAISSPNSDPVTGA